MGHDVFVSHSSEDAKVAAAVVTRLEAESIRCWIAPRDVVPGADWGESIIDAIESSRIMILVFSRNSDASRQIKREVERADHKGVYTIPFRIEDIEPTNHLRILFRLRTEWTRFSRRWNGIWIPLQKRSQRFCPVVHHHDRLRPRPSRKSQAFGATVAIRATSLI
jgi:hypothetical protein